MSDQLPTPKFAITIVTQAEMILKKLGKDKDTLLVDAFGVGGKVWEQGDRLPLKYLAEIADLAVAQSHDLLAINSVAYGDEPETLALKSEAFTAQDASNVLFVEIVTKLSLVETWKHRIHAVKGDPAALMDLCEASLRELSLAFFCLHSSHPYARLMSEALMQIGSCLAVARSAGGDHGAT